MALPIPISRNLPTNSQALRIREAAERAAPVALAEHKAACHAIYYADPAYPGYSVKEMADGRRFLVRRGPAPGFEQQLIREIPALPV